MMSALKQTFIIKKNHPSLEGHFPANPVVPGVLLLDEISSILLQQYGEFRITGFSQVKFLQPVLAEQLVSVQSVDKTEIDTGNIKIKFLACCLDAPVVQGEVKLEGNVSLK